MLLSLLLPPTNYYYYYSTAAATTASTTTTDYCYYNYSFGGLVMMNLFIVVMLSCTGLPIEKILGKWGMGKGVWMPIPSKPSYPPPLTQYILSCSLSSM